MIALVGMPGSGKSTVGKQLARQLARPFFDSDHEIERRIGMPIKAYFDRHGEDSFRSLEQSVIAELAKQQDGILATGGGAVIRAENRRSLAAGGPVIYLRSSPEELFRRLRHDSQRPLLQVADPLRRLRDLFRDRDPLYRETAQFVIETGRPTVPTLVNMILMQLELAGLVDPGRTAPPSPTPGPPTA